MPASTTVVQNTTGQNVDVTITGGTLTSVVVNGVQAGTTAGSYSLPPGGSISITYSVAPTWAWTDPINLSGAPFTAAENLGPVNEQTDTPFPAHAEGGEPGLGIEIDN
jgi:hypothetical protein